ncbi:MAG: hypothetical protein WAU81_04095, partial [Candidatus Aminicenantales bacterium]
LRSVFFEHLELIFEDTPADLIDKTYLGNIFWDGIDHFINTLRDVKILLNAIKVTYPPVKGEVNPIDFIALETIRVFSSTVYQLLRSNSEMFVGYSDSDSQPRIEDIKPFHDKLLEQIAEPHRATLKQLLTRLFPKLERVYGNIQYGPDWALTWEKQLRICSPDIFPIYFRLALPTGAISREEMHALLTLAENSEAFGKKLVQLTKTHRPDGSTKLSALLEKMEDYTEEDIPVEHISNILTAFFNIGDELLVPEDEPRGIFSWGNRTRIGRIMNKLLKRYKSEEERFSVLRESILKGRAVSIIVSRVTTLGQQHGKYGARGRPEEEKIITLDHLLQLEEIALSKIEAAAEDNELLKSPEMAHVLYRWRDWGGKEPVRNWASKATASDEGLTNLLVGFLSKSYSMGMTDRVPKAHWRLNPDSIEPFLNPEQVYKRCKNLLESRPDLLTNEKKLAVETFIKGYALKLKGKDPGVPFEWDELSTEE